MHALTVIDDKGETIMNTTKNYSSITSQAEYDNAFWDMIRTRGISDKALSSGADIGTGTFRMPYSSSEKLMKRLEKESLFRQNATVIKAYKTDSKIYAKDCKDSVQFVAEGEVIPIYEGMDDFKSMVVDRFKASTIVRLDTDFVSDAEFDIEDYLTEKFAKAFGRAEDNAYINGTGTNEPTGILNAERGAEVGVQTGSLTYDDVISLYFSVPAEYRKNGSWLMNDKTALALRKLKDSDGNYLWNQSNDTILGKPVLISEFMPDIGKGAKPIAFGDFSYYWVIGRKPVSVRALVEKFALYDQVGYLALEFVDGKLVRSEAIKVLEVTA